MKRQLSAFAAVCVFLLLALAALAENTPDPVRRALLVGCDHFVMHEDTAPSAQMNVRRMQEILRTDIRGYESIYTYETGISGVDFMTSVIEEAFARADADDVSLLYICTHGLYDRITLEPSLVLSDGHGEEILTADALRRVLDAVPGKKILLLDACNSGAFIGKGDWNEQVRNSFQGGDYRVLTSAGAAEDSFLWSAGMQGGSYFADGLSEGLRTRSFDLNGDGTITLQEAYRGVLESHGASTAQCYPQDSDEALYVYDPLVQSTGERPIGEILLDTAVIGSDEDTLYFSFTVHRAVRVQYQLIYYKDGRWRFDMPQIVPDEENENGVLLPGRKERSLTLVSEDDTPTGYVLLQIVATEGRHSMLAGSRLIAVQEKMADPKLTVRTEEKFSPRTGEEMTVRVGHDFPCSLNVVIRDSQGNSVRRLAYREPSRPAGETNGSLFYWNGRDNRGEYVPAGTYYAEVSCKTEDQTYTQNSVEFTLTAEGE
ncbi:MAG: caspase family protein [Clostridia bacterium]|nr:caspase family protein [Clostridia bacterium]